MNKTEHFLKNLTDQELAFLVKCRLSSFLKNSQNKILLEVNSRHLNEKKLNSLIANPKQIFNSEHESCPKCFSNKIVTSSESLLWTSKAQATDGLFLNKQTNVNRKECIICGFIIQDLNNGKTWLNFIKKFFIRLSSLKVFSRN